MPTADRLCALAAAIGGNAWGLHIGKPRVYLSARLLHAKVYLAFPKATDNNLGRPVLRIQHNRPRRPYSSRKRITVKEYNAALLAARQWVQNNE
jgi:hypothetical protein